MSTLHHDFPALTYHRLVPYVTRAFPPQEVIPREQLGFDPIVPGWMFTPLRFVEWHKGPYGERLTLSEGDRYTLLIGRDADPTVTGGCLVLTGREVHHDGPLGECVRGRTPDGERVIELFHPRRQHVHLRPHPKPWERRPPVDAPGLIELSEGEIRRRAATFDPTTWREAVAGCIERRLGADLNDLPGLLADWAAEFPLSWDWLVTQYPWEDATARVRRTKGILDVRVSFPAELDIELDDLDQVAYAVAQILLHATAHYARVKVDCGRARPGCSERIELQDEGSVRGWLVAR